MVTVASGMLERTKIRATSVLGVVKRHELDFFKLDFNVASLEGGQHVREGFAEGESWRHMETLYATFDEVRRTFPDVALENCASGGGRNDYGMLARFHYASESDFSEFPRSIRTINAMTRFLPPDALCYYHNHMPVAHHRADVDTHLRVIMFAQPIFVGFGSQQMDRESEFCAKTKRYLGLWKEVAKPVLAGGARVYHHTPDIGLYADAPWCVLEYAARDRSLMYAGLFRLAARGEDEYRFLPRGLDASRRYAVTYDNAGHTVEREGAELIDRGVGVRVSCTNTSELLMFRAVD